MTLYKTLIFDCDGVILNSNKIKTEAFYKVALPFGESIAEDLKEFHKKNGGISRFIKFEYFLKELLNIKYDKDMVNGLAKEYGDIVYQELLDCEVSSNLKLLKNLYPKAGWMVASGSFQVELRTVLDKKLLSNFFNKGIFGSPDSKEEILERELSLNNVHLPALFIGDSEYDYISASKFGLDFIFMSKWTEMEDWQEYFNSKNIHCVKNFKELSSFLTKETKRNYEK